MPIHKVSQGEHLASIASAYGFENFETIWKLVPEYWGQAPHPSEGKTVWAEIVAAMPVSWESAAGAGRAPAIPAPAPGPALWDETPWSMMAGTETGGNADR